MSSPILVREAIIEDCNQLLDLMKKLAEFEGYLDEFAVTEANLIERGFRQKDFYALVAEVDDKLIGMLVYYFLPFTYDLKPWLFIKELYVDSEYRGQGTGQLLMKKAARICQQIGASKMRWDVLTSNHKAQHFYQQMGAEKQTNWSSYQLSGPALKYLTFKK